MLIALDQKNVNCKFKWKHYETGKMTIQYDKTLKSPAYSEIVISNVTIQTILIRPPGSSILNIGYGGKVPDVASLFIP